MSASSPSSRWLKWLLLGVLVLGIALGIARALSKRQAKADAVETAAQTMQQAPVYQLSAADLTQVAQRDLDLSVRVSGSIKALQTAAIKARVAGELQGLTKREGDAVKAGEMVARIDATEAQARVRQAEQQAQAALAQVQIARRTQDNNQSLVQQGFISSTALETSTSNLAGAQANHLAAVAALDIARKTLGDTQLRSPLTGQVSARLVQNGERVPVDARVLEVVDLSAFEMEAALTPADAAAVAVGQKALLHIEGLADSVETTVSRINPSVQPGSRAVLVYLRVPATTGMRQGLFAEGEIVTGRIHTAAVPLSTVRNDRPQPYIQVVSAGRVQHVPVVIGRQGMAQGETQLTLDGVAGAPVGTQVLRAQAGAIREGTEVRLLGPSAAAGSGASN